MGGHWWVALTLLLSGVRVCVCLRVCVWMLADTHIKSVKLWPSEMSDPVHWVRASLKLLVVPNYFLLFSRVEPLEKKKKKERKNLPRSDEGDSVGSRFLHSQFISFTDQTKSNEKKGPIFSMLNDGMRAKVGLFCCCCFFCCITSWTFSLPSLIHVCSPKI